MKRVLFVFVFCSLFSFIYANNLYEEFEKSREKYEAVLNSSKDKDIVVFLGATGSGKSTTLNFLYDINMKVVGLKVLEVVNKEDPNQFVIGGPIVSQTFVPQYRPHPQLGEDVLFYDMPGFGDNRDLETSLLGAVFIKNIIEKARTCKLVFVMLESDLTGNKVEGYLKRKNIIFKMFEAQKNKLSKISVLLLTKASMENTDEEYQAIKNILSPNQQETLTDEYEFNPWQYPNLLVFTQPAQTNINLVPNQEQKEYILKVIRELEAQKIVHVNIGHIFSETARANLEKYFDEENIKIFNSERIRLLDSINTKPLDVLENIDAMEEFLQFFKARVENEVNKSCFFRLFEPIASDMYQNSHAKLKRLVEDFLAEKAKEAQIARKVFFTNQAAKIKLQQEEIQRLNNSLTQLENKFNENKLALNETKAELENTKLNVIALTEQFERGKLKIQELEGKKTMSMRIDQI